VLWLCVDTLDTSVILASLFVFLSCICGLVFLVFWLTDIMIILLYFEDNFVLFKYFLVAIGRHSQSLRPRRAELDALTLQRNPRSDTRLERCCYTIIIRYWPNGWGVNRHTVRCTSPVSAHSVI